MAGGFEGFEAILPQLRWHLFSPSGRHKIVTLRKPRPLSLLFVIWTVLPPNLQHAGQSKQGSSVVLEAERSRRSLAGQQGHRPTSTQPALCKTAHTQRKDGAVLQKLLQSSTVSHPDNMYLPVSCLSQLTNEDDPKAVLWVCEGLAVACGLPEEEAGRKPTSSDCSQLATLLY